VQQDRRQEEDRGVQIQDGRHGRDEPQGDAEQRPGADRQARELRPGGGEETVALGGDADEEEPGDERERRPDLPCG